MMFVFYVHEILNKESDQNDNNPLHEGANIKTRLLNDWIKNIAVFGDILLL